MFAHTPESRVSQSHSGRESQSSGFLSKGELVVMILVVVLLVLYWVNGGFRQSTDNGDAPPGKVQAQLPAQFKTTMLVTSAVSNGTALGQPWTATGEVLLARSMSRSRVVIRQVRVLPTKQNGRNWDSILSRDPDLKVSLDHHGTVFYTDVMRNTLEADFQAESPLWVSVGDRIALKVMDRDRTNRDDLIGQKTIKITEDMILRGSVDIPAFGQVTSLRLEFHP